MKEQVIAEVSIVPIGTSQASIGQYVARCVKLLQNNPDIRHQVTPMGTVLEGPLDRVLKVVQQMHEAPFDMQAQRVLTSIRIDDRRDKMQRMEDKVSSASRK